MNLDDLITQAEAARLRGVTRATMSALVKKGRFNQVPIAGKVFLLRSEVKSFVPDAGGRPPKKAKAKAAGK